MDKQQLETQIKHYNLSNKLKSLAQQDEQRRPFRHLPKQFSKGILIGNIAIVPRKSTETRFVYVIADMIEARVLHDEISLKQTAIMVAHYLADETQPPANILENDLHFASKLFDISNFKRMQKQAEKDNNEEQSFIYENSFIEANRQADELKAKIQSNFNSLFR
tara:strand:+ start:1074 stop:1565 length:492 start_codon:yes stop_codon:yes gene_type:complete